jgi:3-phenylpropionate/trans-cinnamate dioxygenase ferredoxin component
VQLPPMQRRPYTAGNARYPPTNPCMSVPESRWILAAHLSEFGADRKLARSIEGIEILLIQREHGIVAVHNRCTHLQKPLTEGRVFAGQIICPLHGACFDLRTGQAVSGPAVSPLRIFPTRVEGDEVWLDCAD